MEEVIKFTKLSAKYGVLSNFYPCNVTFDGLTYPSSESAWQAQKTLNLSERKKFTECSASVAKKMGRSVNLRSDWESIKYQLMVDVCYAKFSQNIGLAKVLLSTGDAELVENTTAWHDNIWGNCECVKCCSVIGQNLLGKALMEVRAKLREK